MLRAMQITRYHVKIQYPMLKYELHIGVWEMYLSIAPTVLRVDKE